jgi:hypothetical protein
MNIASSMKNERPRSSPRFPQHNKAQHVGLGKMHIFEFTTNVGDNPPCTAGVPVPLGMPAKSSMDADIDFYELCDPSPQCRRKIEIRLSLPDERAARYVP